jgi:septal ring factor EnvC (AmiA/AmiB activator)
MADDLVIARLSQLENAVRQAGDALARLRDENAQLGADIKRLGDENAHLRREAARYTQERQQVLAQIDTLLKDIGKLGLE